MSIEVSSLHVYPVKSCAGIDLEVAELTARGIAHDREFMLVTDEHEPLTQREKHELAVIRTGFIDGNLSIQAPGQELIRHPLDGSADSGPETPLVLFEKAGTGVDQGEEVSAYFSEFLGQSVRLMRAVQPRLIRENTRVEGGTHQTGFADGYALTIGSLASLASFNEYLVANGEQPVPIENFRFNIVVDGDELQPWDEDNWQELTIADKRLFVVRCLGRCIMPNIVQQTGELMKHGPVTKGLAKTRRGIDVATGKKTNAFGSCLDLDYVPGSILRRGDTLAVTMYADDPNIELSSALSLNGLLPQQEHRQRHPVSG